MINVNIIKRTFFIPSFRQIFNLDFIFEPQRETDILTATNNLQWLNNALSGLKYDAPVALTAPKRLESVALTTADLPHITSTLCGFRAIKNLSYRFSVTRNLIKMVINNRFDLFCVGFALCCVECSFQAIFCRL